MIKTHQAPLTKVATNDCSPLKTGSGSILFRIVLVFLVLVSGKILLATAAEIRDNVLSNIPKFVTLRDPDPTHGNQYAFDDTAIIAADYDLPTIDFSLFPEKVQVTYFTKVTIALGGYPVNNKIVIDWGDYTSSKHYVNSSAVNNVSHQYASTVSNYLVTIKTYYPSGTTYTEEPEHEIQYDLGIFPYTESVSVASNSTEHIGKLTHYQSHVSGSTKKPVLIVEGFNFHNSNNISSIVGLNPVFYKSLLDNGFDLYFLTFEKSQASLYENAGLVLSALTEIRNKHDEAGEYGGFGCQPIKVIGYSMGGVLARIALASAEDQGAFAHGSNLLLTVDSPHRGFVINENVQNHIVDFIDTIVDHEPGIKDQVESLLETFDVLIDSPIARQLVRNNVTAESTTYTFFDGSNEYKDVFDFLNPCEARNVMHVNQDVDYYNSGSYNEELDYKSGFPWKQNNIRKYAVAFGSAQPVGNIEDNGHFASLRIKWKILGFPGSYTLDEIHSKWYDKCPASYFPTEFHYKQKVFPDSWHNSVLEDVLSWIINSDKLKIHFNVNYDLPIIPVISSLCMTNRDFAEPSQTQFTPYGSAISGEIRTPFDEYFIPSDASPHTILSPQCAQWIRSSLTDNNEERIVGHITGVLRSNNQPLANQPIIVTNLSSGDVFELSTNASGSFQFDNYYVNTCAYEIKHADAIYYEKVVSAVIDIIGNADIGYIDLTAPQQIVFVDKDLSSGVCHTISNAFDVSMSLNIPHIVVNQGTYRERVLVLGLGDYFQNFTLEGIGNVVIHSNERGHALKVWNLYSDILDELTIKNIIFEDTDNEGGGGVYLSGNIGHVTMEHCTIRNCGDCYIIPGSDKLPTGLESYAPIHIIDCDFYDNYGHQLGTGSDSIGAVCLSSNNPINHSIIESSRFHDNMASSASAIHVRGKGRYTIKNNFFSNNKQIQAGYTSCVTCLDATNVEIINNTFKNNDNPNAIYSHYQAAIGLTLLNNDSSNITIRNNTVVEQTRALYVFNADAEVVNNIFDVSQVGIRCNDTYDDSRLKYYHNIMKLGANAIPAEQYDINLPENINNQICDAQIDANYRPIWNSTTMSPCIDTGFGEDDPDGTPPDIGAIPAIQHRYWEYSFENQHDLDKWYWVSYPVLNTITDNALIANEFFEELLHRHQDSDLAWQPTYLEEIRWVNQGQNLITWTSGAWAGPMNSHSVSSPQGYKIKLLQDVPDVVSLSESGFKTPNNTQFPIYGEVENWLGYFREEPQYPEDAFADIWDDLVSVRAKNWSITRDVGSGLMIGKKGTLNFGDMVIVRTNNDHNTFRWGGNHPVPPDLKPEVKGFVYDEKPDYIPLYVSLSDSLLQDLDEIGLYVDGVCRGAVVVEDSLEQISAYVDNAAELSEGNVEFVFCYNDSKSMEPQMKSMKPPVGRLKAKYSQAGSAYPYFEFKLSPEDMDNIVPPEFSLRQNYPNPFNPTTTIAYSLPEANQVRIDIYNVKGQLVKSLLNKDMEAGLHSIIWNGRDMNNQSVASGIYFYRLSSPSMTQTKRMLLMK